MQPNPDIPAGSLSIADLLSCLYFYKMRVDPKNPKWEDRDRLVLSKGHCAPGLYAALALKGYFPVEELKKLRKPGAMLQGHPDMKGTPGIDMSTGSLGQGFSTACGMAAAAKADHKDYRVYSIIGDGENTRKARFGKLQCLLQITAWIICARLWTATDCRLTAMWLTLILPIHWLKKFASFGFEVITIDAHDYDQILSALDQAEATQGKPTVIIAKSIKGKGVSFMENNVAWHGSAPNDEQYAQAMDELNAQLKSLEVE